MDLIHDKISDRIVQTARKLIGEKHTGKITVRDILKDMQITNRVFYNRFHNIEEVMEILYQEEVAKVRESLFTPFREGDDFGAYVENVAVGTFKLSNGRQHSMSRYVFELDSTNSKNYEWWSNAIRQIIVQGKELHYFRLDLDETAICYSIWCFIRGFSADAVARELPKDEAVRIFRYGFGCFIAGIRA